MFNISKPGEVVRYAVHNVEHHAFRCLDASAHNLRRIQGLIEEWTEELREPLDAWLGRLTDHVLAAKRALRRSAMEAESVLGDGAEEKGHMEEDP